MSTQTRLLFLAFIITFGMTACKLPNTSAEATFTSTPSQLPASAPESTKLPTTPIAALEFYQLALAQAQKWQPDAALMELDSSILTQLEADGRSVRWSARFWSASAQHILTLTLINGSLLAQTRAGVDPGPPLALEGLNWDLKNLLQKAAQAGGKGNDQTKGYNFTAGLRPDDVHPTTPTWIIIYLRPDRAIPPIIVTLDAHSSQILRVDIEE